MARSEACGTAPARASATTSTSTSGPRRRSSTRSSVGRPTVGMTTERCATAVDDIRVDPDRELAELREYLGDDYRLAPPAAPPGGHEEELAQLGDRQRLYRESLAYLYDLTVFAMSRHQGAVPGRARRARSEPPRAGARLRLRHRLGRAAAARGRLSRRVRGLRLALDASTCAGACEHRGLDAPIHDLDRAAARRRLRPGVRVRRHRARARRVRRSWASSSPAPGSCSSTSSTGEDRNPLHEPLDVDALLDHVTARGLRRYRVHHGRSHLVLYAPRRRTPVRSRLVRLRGGRVAR